MHRQCQRVSSKGLTAWRRADLEHDTSWINILSKAEIRELDDAMRSTMAQGLDIIEINSANFPLPTLGDTLRQMRNELIEGRGVTGNVR